METGVKEVELRDLWRRYKEEGDAEARGSAWSSPTRRWSSSSPAGSAAGLPSHVDDADLISYGLIGLIGAIERFEPERGIKFETFAMTRIRGAIIDELRSLDWVPRSVRARAREIEARPARSSSTSCSGRRPRRSWRPSSRSARRTAGVAAGDRQLLGLRARRAVDRLRLLRATQVSLLDTIQDPRADDPQESLASSRGQGPADRRDRARCPSASSSSSPSTTTRT